MTKKVLLIVAAVLAIGAVAGYYWFNSSNSEKALGDDIAGVVSVESYLNSDRAYMTDSVSPKYKWYETCIKMTGEVDTLQEPTLEMVTNVFQVLDGDSISTKAMIYGGKHLNGEFWWDIKEGLWIEDIDMTSVKDSIITFEDAFKKLKESNCVQPKSKFCTLREPLGPNKCNPQYIFGNNNRGTVFVDAITGEVRTDNPAFNKGENFDSAKSAAIFDYVFSAQK